MSDWTPLAGTTVVDLSQQLPGPFATLLLKTLGARVVKVEPPGGEHGRSVDPPMFRRTNAGKEVVFLDLKDGDDRARLHELVADADVFVEGFRPGVTARLGADWDTLSALNPRLVYCSMSGMGAEGPLATVPGHDLNFLALSGGLPAGLPDAEQLIRVPWVDLGSAANAALLIVAALADRERTGTGRRIDVALLDAAAIWAATKLPRDGSEGAYGVFATADGRRAAVSVLETAMWRRLCDALGWDDWRADPELDDPLGRRRRAAEVAARLTAEVAARDAATLEALAREHDLPLTLVNDVQEARMDPQIAARGLFPDGAWRPLGPSAPAVPVDDPALVDRA